jgi:aspartate aminotransferase-like enzyme
VLEEGLEERWRRHATVAAALRAGLEALGLRVSGDRVLSVEPLGDAAEVRRQMLDEFGILIGLADDGMWRIGLLGAEARLDCCLRLLAALEQVLVSRGHSLSPGAAREAAQAATA